MEIKDKPILNGIVQPKLKHQFSVEFLDIHTGKIIPGTEYLTANIIKVHPFIWGNSGKQIDVQDDLMGRSMDAVYKLFFDKIRFTVSIKHLDGNDQIVEVIQFLDTTIYQIYRDSWCYDPNGEQIDYVLQAGLSFANNENIPEWVKEVVQYRVQSTKRLDQTMIHKIVLNCDACKRYNREEYETQLGTGITTIKNKKENA